MLSELSQSINSLRVKSDSYLRYITIISQEIKSLESELQSLSIGIHTAVEVGEDNLNQREKEEFSVESVGDWKFLKAFTKESIVWDRDLSSGKFRLLYCRTIYEDRANTEGDFSTNVYASNKFPDGISELRPLIEAPIDVRIRCHSKLSSFVKNIETKIDELVKGLSVFSVEDYI